MNFTPLQGLAKIVLSLTKTSQIEEKWVTAPNRHLNVILIRRHQALLLLAVSSVQVKYTRVTNSIRIRFWTFTQKMSEDVYNAENSSTQLAPRPKSLCRILKRPKSQANPRSCVKRCIPWVSARLIWCRSCYRKSHASLKPLKSRSKL